MLLLQVTRSCVEMLPDEAAAQLVPIGHAAVACCPDEPAELFTLPAYRSLPVSRRVDPANVPPPMPAAPDAGDEPWAQLRGGSGSEASTRAGSPRLLVHALSLGGN